MQRCKTTGRSGFTSSTTTSCSAIAKSPRIAPNLIITVVNLDPRYAQSGFVNLPLEELGIPNDRAYEAEDLLSGERYLWNGSRNYVELNPSQRPGHILRIQRKLKAETDFEYFL